MNHGKRSEGSERKIRLNRYLAGCGLGSRRACDRMIAAGAIRLNGVRVDRLGVQIDPGADRVEYAGKVVRTLHPLGSVAFHKSRGTIVSARDPGGRETIYDALARVGLDGGHLRYVGRLDRNSEGLLLLTNDGEMIHALTHPRFHVKKVYRVLIDRPLRPEEAERMTGDGIPSEGQLLRAGEVRFSADVPSAKGFWYEVDLYEGKNRQIRRMFEALGRDVLRLKRIQFGVVKLGTLRRGRFRYLTEREVEGLRRLGHKVKKQNGRKGGVG